VLGRVNYQVAFLHFIGKFEECSRNDGYGSGFSVWIGSCYRLLECLSIRLKVRQIPDMRPPNCNEPFIKWTIPMGPIHVDSPDWSFVRHHPSCKASSTLGLCFARYTRVV
jgi:hypothetical protein